MKFGTSVVLAISFGVSEAQWGWGQAPQWKAPKAPKASKRGWNGNNGGGWNGGSGGAWTDAPTSAPTDAPTSAPTAPQCFKNKGFELLSECLSKEPLAYSYTAPLDRRRLDAAVDPENRRLGRDTRAVCMDVGGFPIYLSGGSEGSGQTYLTCCPACDIYPQEDILKEHCTAVHACGQCDGGEGGALCVGFGTNNPVNPPDCFFAYCCPNTGFVDFVNQDPNPTP